MQVAEIVKTKPTDQFGVLKIQLLGWVEADGQWQARVLASERDSANIDASLIWIEPDLIQRTV